MSLGDLFDEDLKDILENSFGVTIRESKKEPSSSPVLEDSITTEEEEDYEEEEEEEEAPAYYSHLSQVDPSFFKY